MKIDFILMKKPKKILFFKIKQKNLRVQSGNICQVYCISKVHNVVLFKVKRGCFFLLCLGMNPKQKIIELFFKVFLLAFLVFGFLKTL
jgi:hypothetical protein